MSFIWFSLELDNILDTGDQTKTMPIAVQIYKHRATWNLTYLNAKMKPMLLLENFSEWIESDNM